MKKYGKLKFKKPPLTQPVKWQPFSKQEESKPIFARENQQEKEEEAFSSLPQGESRLQGAHPSQGLQDGGQKREVKANQPFTAGSLVETAMMVGISVLLGIIGRYVPVLNIIGVLIFPLPTVILVLRRGLKAGLLGAVATFLLLALFTNPLVALIMMMQYLSLGLFLGYAFRMGFRPVTTVLIGTLIASFGTITNLVLSTFVAGLPLEGIYVQMEEMTEVFVSALERSGSLAQMLPADMTVEEYQAQLMNMITTMLPGALIAASMGLTVLNYLIFGAVLRRLNYHIPALPPFSQWRMDWRMIWGVIAALLLNFLGGDYDNALLSQIGGNILYMYYFLLLTFGLALIAWLLKNWQAERFVKIIAVLFIVLFALNNFGMLMIIGIGLFDPILDFRTRLAPLMKK